MNVGRDPTNSEQVYVLLPTHKKPVTSPSQDIIVYYIYGATKVKATLHLLLYHH